jgi:trk system potassium uptake protein TrkH
MRLGLVLSITGRLMVPFCAAFAFPTAMALRDGLFDPEWSFRVDEGELAEAVNFVVTLGLALGFGMWFGRKQERPRVFLRAEALAVVTLTWVLIALFGGLPYVLGGMSVVDALFESVSGFTTTGATILQDFDSKSRAFFLWRAMTQWFGGLGVIALFVVVLPRLGIAGRQIFFAESSSAPSEAVSPSVRQSARRLWVLYTGLTALMAVLLMTTGFSLYEGVVHSLTTLAAGGFSPNGASIFGYQNAAAEWVFVPFMFIAGASFPLVYVAVTRKPWVLLKDGEFRQYFLLSLGFILVIAALLAGGMPGEQELRDASFQVTSLISSAGFASLDYEVEWSAGIKALLIAVMIVGGCAGSAAGGAKQVRFLLVFRFLHRELLRVLHPRAVLPLRHGGERVPDRVMWSVFTLVLLYLMGYVVVAIPVTLLLPSAPGTELSAEQLSTGFSAAVACLSNVGPAYGVAGPMGSYAGFPTLAKLILTGAMLIGRLEIVTVLALFHPDVWRHLRWKDRA